MGMEQMEQMERWAPPRLQQRPPHRGTLHASLAWLWLVIISAQKAELKDTFIDFIETKQLPFPYHLFDYRNFKKIGINPARGPTSDALRVDGQSEAKAVDRQQFGIDRFAHLRRQGMKGRTQIKV